MLENEISCLRELLSNLVLKETAILSNNLKQLEELEEKEKTLKDQEKLLKKTRKRAEKTNSNLTPSTDEICYYQQIKALNEKISSQNKVNQNLKKTNSNSSSFPLPLEKKETKKKKRPLLLEDDPS